MKLFILSVISLTFVVYSCKKVEGDTFNFHYDYYPLEEGTFVVYEAMDIAHDRQALIQSDTNRYYLRTVIGESFVDNSGSEAHKFFRYEKLSLDDEWELKDVWTTRLYGQRIELVEENDRVVKLVFPCNEEKLWDINAYNIYDKISASYPPELLHKPGVFGTFVLNSTIRVDVDKDFNLVKDINMFEVYAKGVGLVQKHFKQNRIQNFDTLNIDYGRETHYRMIDFGRQ
jgi:hypothetical protein